MPHLHDKIDFTSEVFIVHKDRVLLRMHDKFKFWLSVGGHIELDEDPVQAALREVKEEVGLDVVLHGADGVIQCEPGSKDFICLLPPKFLCRMKISETHEHVTFVYFATTESTEIKAEYADDLSEECRWFSLAELEDPANDFKPNVRFYAVAALKELGSM